MNIQTKIKILKGLNRKDSKNTFMITKNIMGNSFAKKSDIKSFKLMKFRKPYFKIKSYFILLRRHFKLDTHISQWINYG